jgi:hypothetical protein
MCTCMRRQSRLQACPALAKANACRLTFNPMHADQKPSI